MAAVGLSTLGFLGICLVWAIVPMDYNGKTFSIFYILVMGIMEQTVGFHLLCEVTVLGIQNCSTPFSTSIIVGIAKGFHSNVMTRYSCWKGFSISYTCCMVCVS